MTHAMKRRVTVLASMISVLLVASVAFAAWTANGTGSGRADAGTSQAVVVTAGAGAVTDALTPHNVGDVRVVVQNPNDYNVAISSITQQAGEAITASGGIGDCDATNHAVTYAAQNLTDKVLAAGATYTFTLDNAVSMGNSAQGCQGATFSLPLLVSASSTSAAGNLTN